ncbi:hypothetical protein LguiA_032600 [Lonicera macranthoides]
MAEEEEQEEWKWQERVKQLRDASTVKVRAYDQHLQRTPNRETSVRTKLYIKAERTPDEKLQNYRKLPEPKAQQRIVAYEDPERRERGFSQYVIFPFLTVGFHCLLVRFVEFAARLIRRLYVLLSIFYKIFHMASLDITGLSNLMFLSEMREEESYNVRTD